MEGLDLKNAEMSVVLLQWKCALSSVQCRYLLLVTNYVLTNTYLVIYDESILANIYFIE